MIDGITLTIIVIYCLYLSILTKSTQNPTSFLLCCVCAKKKERPTIN